MDHHHPHSGGGGGGSSSSSRGRGRKSGGGNNNSSNSNKYQQLQQQQERLLLEFARSQQQQQQGNANSQALAELFAQAQAHEQQRQQHQQQSSSSRTSNNNPLSLLQQQMNAIMQQGGGGNNAGFPPATSLPSSMPPTSTSSSGGGAVQQAQQAQQWWSYLEYLSRIQAAQMIPNLDPNSNANNTPTQQETPPPPQSSSSSKKVKKEKPPPQAPPQKIEQKRSSTSSQKRKNQEDSPSSAVVNLSKLIPSKVQKLSRTSPPPSPSVTIQPIAASTAAGQPPPAHSTPTNLSLAPGKKGNSNEGPPPPAHQYKIIHYTHMIPKLPQIGLIGGNARGSKGDKKKKTVASLLAQSRESGVSINSKEPSSSPYRPWLQQQQEESKLVIPNIIGNSKHPDFTLPLKMGWKRETFVKNTDFKSVFEGSVVYTTPQGIKCKSVNEVKKCLNQRTAELTPRHFTYSSTNPPGLLIGTYTFDYDSDRISLQDSDLTNTSEESIIKKLTQAKTKLDKERELLRLKLMKEEEEKIERERKRQHQAWVKSLEILKKSKRRAKLQQERKLKRRLELEEEDNKDCKDFVDELLTECPELKELKKLGTGGLDAEAFSNLLQIYEFLGTFGETLGFDGESLPRTLGGLLKGFTNPNPTQPSPPEEDSSSDSDSSDGEENYEEELQSILIHLIVCAVEDPGMPNPTKHLTTFNQTLKQADVNFGSFSEILRIYLDGISDSSEPEAETYAQWLSEAPFTCHNPKRKTQIVAYICDLLLQNKAVLKHLENSTELIHNCKKERASNEVKIRKLRMVLARRAVAQSMVLASEGVGKEGETSEGTVAVKEEVVVPPVVAVPIEEEVEDKLSVEELKAEMTQLQSTNEKLQKQMGQNYKSIRTVSLGQDRWRRRYWNLPNSGGIYVEGGKSAVGAGDELRGKVDGKFASTIEEEPQEIEENKENGVTIKEEPMEESSSQIVAVPFEVPPPVIKIFSFQAKESLCSGKRPYNSKEEKKKKGPTDDEVFLEKIKKPHYWNGYFYLHDDKECRDFAESLVESGIREGGLKDVLAMDEEDTNYMEKLIKKPVDPECLLEEEEDDDIINADQPGVDPDLVFKIHLGLIETLEGLEERVAGASLQVKNWTLPLPRNLHLQQQQPDGNSSPKPMLKQEEIVSIVKDRLLDLEQAVERRYLKPPLGKSANELNLSNLVGEDNANVMISGAIADGVLLNGGPCGSTSSTRGAQIQENNKLKELREKEERLEKANESKNANSRFLTHWRESVKKTSSPSVLSMAIYLLDSSIAWDKSVMKACCQLCKGGDHEDKLLLCDACDRGYHTYCFKPPLEQIPEGDWFCWECINKATGNRGCIVCGKGNLQGKKLLACDKCVKAFHTDCIVPNVVKVPRGRWYCPDHQPSASSNNNANNVRKSTTSESSASSPKKKSTKSSEPPAIPPPPTPTTTTTVVVPPPPTPPLLPPPPPTTPLQSDDETSINNSMQKDIEDPPEEQLSPLPPPPPVKKSKKLKKELAWCEKVLTELIQHEDAWPFLDPVNTRQFPTYRKIIKTPMDLSTIKKNLPEYKSRDCFLTDVRLIFDNCETFNEDDSPVGKAGHNLRVFFESLLNNGGTAVFINNSSANSNNSCGE